MGCWLVSASLQPNLPSCSGGHVPWFLKRDIHSSDYTWNGWSITGVPCPRSADFQSVRYLSGGGLNGFNCNASLGNGRTQLKRCACMHQWLAWQTTWAESQVRSSASSVYYIYPVKEQQHKLNFEKDSQVPVLWFSRKIVSSPTLKLAGQALW